MKWSGKVDTQGFRILKDQTLNLDTVSDDIMIQMLRDSVLYEDGKYICSVWTFLYRITSYQLYFWGFFLYFIFIQSKGKDSGL